MPRRTRQPDARASRSRHAPVPAPASSLITVADVQKILAELTHQLAPADLVRLLAREPELRARAAELASPEFTLLREQLELALDCLRDHVTGRCPQVPFSTITTLAAAVSYFADELDLVPDFLHEVGRLDDGAVMAMAFQLAADGIRRYCAANERSAEALLGAAAGRRLQNDIH